MSTGDGQVDPKVEQEHGDPLAEPYEAPRNRWVIEEDDERDTHTAHEACEPIAGEASDSAEATTGAGATARADTESGGEGDEAAEPSQTSGEDDEGSPFECNICFEVACEPVVTSCGHLYCWPCIYRWIHSDRSVQTCPVCKNGISQEKLIPLYGRHGPQVDPRSRIPEGVPPRPRPERSEPQGMFPNFMPTHGNGGFTFSAGVGFFPSLFGLQFQTLQVGPGMGPNGELTEEQQRQQFLSRVAFAFASVILILTILLN